MKLDNFSQLKDHFAVAEQPKEERAEKSKNLQLYYSLYDPLQKVPSWRQTLSKKLEIGAIVYVKLGAFMPDYEGDREVIRPAIVQALWRNNENKIIKIEVLPLTTRLSKLHHMDLPMPIAGEVKGRMTTATSHLIDNINEYVYLTKKYPQQYIDSTLWPDILVRRAYNILYSGNLNLTMPSGRDDGLTREGFTFDEIQPHFVKNGMWVPDLPGGNFNRVACSVVPQDTVNQIARYAGYFMENIARGDRGMPFPPQEKWLKEFSFAGFRDWKNERIREIMGSHGL